MAFGALGPGALDPDNLISTFGLIGVLVVVFAESGLLIGFFLSGDSLLFTAGLLVAEGSYVKLPCPSFGHSPRSWPSSPGCPTRTLVLFNVIGGVLWGAGVAVLGFHLGQISFVRTNMEFILVAVVAVSFVPIAIEVLRARQRGRGNQPADRPLPEGLN
jgi:membrane protein DedA with SNARE-associated domain